VGTCSFSRLVVALTYACLESTPLAERENKNFMIALDCEMSGLDPVKHSILSIGAVDLENSKRSFYGECFLPENKTFQVEALAVNGFTEEQIFDKSKDSLKQLMEKFYEWLQGCSEKTLVGQNVSLDRAFLNTAFSETEVPFQFHYRVIDLHSVGCAMFLTIRDERYSIAALNGIFLCINIYGIYNYMFRDSDLLNKIITSMSSLQHVI
jgi:DNA polymerase III epsilon subunit-like protein